MQLALNDKQIIGLETSHVDPKYGLLPDVAVAYTAMQQAAADNGFDLQIVSSFRDFKAQELIWNSKIQGKRMVLDRQANEVDVSSLDDDDLMYTLLIWSAFPGASRHHWGTDLDVYDANAINLDKVSLIQEEYYQGACAPMFNWLTKNAEKFGFFWPYLTDRGGFAVEPWHLSYTSISTLILKNYPENLAKSTLRNSSVILKNNLLSNFDNIAIKYIYNIDS